MADEEQESFPFLEPEDNSPINEEDQHEALREALKNDIGAAILILRNMPDKEPLEKEEVHEGYRQLAQQVTERTDKKEEPQEQVEQIIELKELTNETPPKDVIKEVQDALIKLEAFELLLLFHEGIEVPPQLTEEQAQDIYVKIIKKGKKELFVRFYRLVQVPPDKRRITPALNYLMMIDASLYSEMSSAIQDEAKMTLGFDWDRVNKGYKNIFFNIQRLSIEKVEEFTDFWMVTRIQPPPELLKKVNNFIQEEKERSRNGHIAPIYYNRVEKCAETIKDLENFALERKFNENYRPERYDRTAA